jgi:hypothetical protein
MRSGRRETQMKRQKRHSLGALTFAVVLGSIELAAAPPPPETPGNVTRFSAVMSVPVAGAAAAPMRVEVKNWYLVRAAKGFRLPAQGFYIAQLRSGKVVTEIAGKSEKRSAGDFWTVGAGVPMTVTIAPRGEAAQLQTIAINPTP